VLQLIIDVFMYICHRQSDRWVTLEKPK